MFRIKNTADDRAKHLLHRTAAKFELEPSLGGYRIRLGTYYDITDEHYSRVKPVLDEWVKKGMVEVTNLALLEKWKDQESAVRQAFEMYDDAKRKGLITGGPTLEEWTAAGYLAENYPPEGYAEVFSPGLVAFRRGQEEEAQKVAEAAASVIKDALVMPSVTEQVLPATPATEEPVLPPAPVTPPPAQPNLGKADKNKKFR